MSAKQARTGTLEIDHREVLFPEGVTVLRAAELNGVYVPALCSHKDLTPFGGCRMCMVEIAGQRGYPLACSTVAVSGMKVLTDTVALRQMRKEILQLILSEHPSSCLICTEQEECRENQYTVRKAGVTTGCRYCPNDGQCELQKVVQHIGITDIEYPIIYRGYEVEHDDPFFDRDYNLCILCGRCVRMCQEVRGTSVLAFKFRGPRARIGPAFSKSHIEAGCEFCGACVTVCPTGTLADKASKWDGKPDGLEVSTCPFCALGCQIELYHKNGRLSRVEAHLDPEVNDGQLCVRGRFCLPEATHHHTRAKKPMLKRGKYFREVTWNEALDEVASRLRDLRPEDFLLLVSGDLTNEGLYTAQKFVRRCLNSNSIDSTARASLPGGLGLWTRLFSLPISIRGLREADVILAVGLDSRFYFSVAGVEIRHALRHGARLVTIDARESNLARYTDLWLRPAPGDEGTLLAALVRHGGRATKGGLTSVAATTEVDQALFEQAADALADGKSLAVVVGPTVFGYADPPRRKALVEALLKLAQRENTTFLPLYMGTNTRGALELGAFGEVLPGGKRCQEPFAAQRPCGGSAQKVPDTFFPRKGISLADVLDGKAKPKVIYLVGEVPFFTRPQCDFVIAQGLYSPPFEVDAFLPAASFAEAEGTLVNIEGRVQRLVRIEDLPDGAVTGLVRPDWFIFSQLAQRLGSSEWPYQNAKAVLQEISAAIPGFPPEPDRRPRQLTPQTDWGLAIETSAAPVLSAQSIPNPQSAIPNPAHAGSFLLVAEPGGFGHCGVDLSSKVEGLGELGLEEGFRLHPEDLGRLGLKPGEHLTVWLDEVFVTGPVRPDADCPRGAVYYHRPVAFGGLEHRAEFEALYRWGSNPVRVEVQRAGSVGRKPKRRVASARAAAAP